MSFNKAVLKRLENVKDREIILYGSDSFTEIIYKSMKKMNIKILYIVDDNINKKYIDGEKVQEINKLNKVTNVFILVAKLFDHKIAFENLIDYGFEYMKSFEIMGFYGYVAPIDRADLLLGYNREDDLLGFKIFGEENDESYKIVTLGSSFVDYSIGNLNSWSKYLYELLIKEGYNVVIYCGGITGYTSTQDFLKLNRDVIELNPDLVIDLGGMADLFCEFKQDDKLYPYISNYYKKMIDYLTENIEIIAPDTMDCRNITKYTIGNGIKKAEEDVWIDNMRKMKCICNEFDVEFISFFQPMIYYGNPIINENMNEFLNECEKLRFTSAPNRENIYNYCERAVKKIKEINREYIVDITQIFNGKKDMYLDVYHFSEDGNYEVAKEVLKYVKKYVK